jgi:hypothetical protein
MPTDANLAPEDRLREIAAILAEGYLRLTRGRRNAADEPPSGDATAPENSQEDSQKALLCDGRSYVAART